ncbi:unnamed protein product [Lactuca virosa]|uniref:Post-GPI attachment to proteins factor 3 n=1 Tax=Lactuca virosa TaxID=75947 RepID=A0AAU9P4U6_9ASTR|nr:unnamed protein product [Lactuca virosa]
MICTSAIIHKMEKLDCLSGYRYQCMIVREEERDTVGDTPVKYHGKWALRCMMFGGNKVFKPRALVDLAAAVSSALLMNEPQWVGIIVKPIYYSLKGAALHIDTGPGLRIEESFPIEMEKYGLEDKKNDNDFVKEITKLTLKNGSIELPDWASNIESVLWVPVRAINEGLARGTSAGSVITIIRISYISVPCVNEEEHQ